MDGDYIAPCVVLYDRLFTCILCHVLISMCQNECALSLSLSLSLSACLNMKDGTAFTKIVLNLFYELNSLSFDLVVIMLLKCIKERKKKKRKDKTKLIKL